MASAPKRKNPAGAAPLVVLRDRGAPSRSAAAKSDAPPLVGLPRLTDAELLTGLHQGNADAARELYARFSPDVNRVVWKLLGGDAEHNDLVHDVFVSAWSQIASGTEPRDLSSWLVGIAANRVRKEIRKRGVRRRFAHLTAVMAPRSVRPNVEGPDLLRRVYALLEKLDADDRVAYALRYLDRRSLEETAQACGCSLSTAKRRIARARRRLVQLSARYPDLHELFTAAERTDP